MKKKSEDQILVGVDILLQSGWDRIQGKKVCVVTNRSAFLAEERHVVDPIGAHENVQLVALF